MSLIIPPSPVDSPFGSYNWADWYEKVRRAINNATNTIPVSQGGTGLTSYSVGDILYASAAQILARRSIGSTGDVLTVAGGLPVWAPPATSGTVTHTGGALTQYAVIVGNGSNDVMPLASLGTSGWVLTSQGAGVAPIFAAAAGGAASTLTSISAAYGFVLADANNAFLHPSADTTARIWTIPANASIAFPIGTTLTGYNQNAAGVITLSITTDTMRLALTGTTGSRTIAANGMFTATKLTTTEWLVNGVGIG